MFAVTVYFGHYFAAAHYDYAVGHAEDLRHFRRYHDNALALLDKAIHYVVNLDLCADVDTTGRLIHDQKLYIFCQCLCDLYQLLFTYANILDQSSGGFFKSYYFQIFICFSVGFIPVNR